MTATEHATKPPALYGLVAGTASPDPALIMVTRKAAGDSQIEAAHRLGVGRRTWQEWERNETPMAPNLWLLYQLLTDQHERYGLYRRHAA